MENTYSKGKIAHIAGITAIACSILGALTFNNAHAVQAGSENNFNLTVINQTKCPMQIAMGGGKSEIPISAQQTFLIGIGQQVALYETVLLNGKCSASAASTSSVSVYSNGGTTIDQGRTAWVTPEVSINASIDGVSKVIGAGAQYKSNTLAKNIVLTVIQ